jgi:hypothetical protein
LGGCAILEIKQMISAEFKALRASKVLERLQFGHLEPHWKKVHLFPTAKKAQKKVTPF